MSRVAEWLKSAGLGQFSSDFNNIDEDGFLALQVRLEDPHLVFFSILGLVARRPGDGVCRAIIKARMHMQCQFHAAPTPTESLLHVVLAA